jgi:hypothetical protein
LLPRFISISDAVRYGGCGRTKIYEFGARYPGLIKKNGAASVVNLPIFDQILDALPEAQIKPTGHR